MWEEIFAMAGNSGIWALLFVTLFFIQLKDSKQREEKYQTTINVLSDNLTIVKNIHSNVVLISETMEEMKKTFLKDENKIVAKDDIKILDK